MAAKKKKNENNNFGVLKFFIISFAVLIFGGAVLLLAIIVERGSDKIEEVNSGSEGNHMSAHGQFNAMPMHHPKKWQCDGKDVTVAKEKSVKGFFADKKHVFLYLEGDNNSEKIVTVNFCTGKVVSTITLE